MFYFCSGTIEDTELIDGLVFNQKGGGQGGPNKVEKAKIGLIQFCISPPKTDVNSLSLLHLWSISDLLSFFIDEKK